MNEPNISVIGLGYVGSVTAACLARDGFRVIGVDVNDEKVGLVNQGHPPVVEPGLADVLGSVVKDNRLRATTDLAEAVGASDVSVICVGTPSTDTGALSTEHVESVCREIGAAVCAKDAPHSVVLRSTVPMGTTQRVSAVLREAAGSVSTHMAFVPEFLREATALRDYDEPAYVIIGTDSEKAESIVRRMHHRVRAQVIVMSASEAELLKFVSNAWHAVKVVFANEIGRVAKAYDVNGNTVMNVLVRDTKLNVSPAYMQPGNAYGGSCLPKDVGALLALAEATGTPVPLLDAVPMSNRLQLESAVQTVLQIRAEQIGVFGLAFKSLTDDVRESPAVYLVRALIDRGCSVRVFDPSIDQAFLTGANLQHLRQVLPELDDVLVRSPQEFLDGIDALVVTQQNATGLREMLQNGRRPRCVVDLAAALREDPPQHVEYHGLSW